MMYLIYNNDGSLKLKNLCEVIDRGDNNTKQIFVAVENRDNDTYSCIANFRLPDGTINQLTGVASTESIDSETTYPGFLITLTAAQTLYPGNVEMAIELLDLNNNVLFTFTTNLQINDTPYVANETYITVAQYNALVAAMNGYQVKFTANNVRKYSSVSALTDDLDNLAVGQVCLYKDSNGLYRIAEIVYDSDTDSNDYEEKGMYLPLLNAAALQINGYDVATKNYVDSSIATEDTFVKANFAHSLGIAASGGVDKITLKFSLYNYAGTRIGSEVSQVLGAATTSYAGILSAADKTKINNIASDIATALATAKAYTDSQVASTYKYKGTKTVAQINALSGQTTGDVYNVSDSGTLTDGNVDVVAGDNVAWDGTKWDKLAGVIDLSGYATLTYVNQLNAENVKLTGTQEIAGSKTFSQDFRRKYGSTGGWTSFGSVPASNVPLNILFNDGNSTVTLLRYELALNGFRFFGNLLAASDENYNIGDSTHRFNDAWITGLLRNGTESITVKQIVDNFTDLTNNKQDNLVSGTNIKTLNNESLLGSGNISYDAALSDVSTNAVQNKVLKEKIDELTYNLNQLKEEFYETTIDIQSYEYQYLLTDTIPLLINSKNVVESIGMDCVDVKGNSYVYNQKIKNGNFADGTDEWVASTGGTISASGGVLSFTAGQNHGRVYQAYDRIAGHKYFCISTLQLTTATDQVGIESGGSLVSATSETTDKQTITFMHTAASSGNVGVGIQDDRTSDFDEIKVYMFQWFDLTQLGIDSVSTTNQAIAELLKLGINPYEYNPYNEGSIKNSKPTKLISGGFNLFDGQWERGNLDAVDGHEVNSDYYARSVNYIKVEPNKSYYAQVSYTNCRVDFWEFDANYNMVKRTTVRQNVQTTVSNNTHYVRLRILDNVNPATTVMPLNIALCFNVSNATLNGTYRPYIAPSEYALDLPILRGVGTAQDDKDYVRIGSYVFDGTEHWDESTTAGGNRRYSLSIDNIKPTGSAGTKGNIMCATLPTITNTQCYNDTEGIAVHQERQSVYVYVASVQTANDMAAYMSGKTIIYELATPTDQVAITLPEDIAIQKGGTITAEYDSTNNCGADFDFELGTSNIQ